MYVKCNEDFLKGRFKFKKGMKCPITNICENTVYFEYPDGTNDFISTSYLEEFNEYVEVSEETLCKHSIENREQIDNLIICSECQELIQIIN